MKSVFRCAFCVLFLLSSVLAEAGSPNHVVLITIDGFGAYEFADPRAPVPNLRRLAAEGVVAEGMKVSTPSITWPNHTSLVTGVRPEKHGVLFNGVLVRPGGEKPVYVDPARDRSELVHGATVYDFLHERGYTTSGINWPCTRNVTTLDDNFPDVPENIRFSTPKIISELTESHVLKEGSDAALLITGSSERDDIWTAATCNSIQRLKPNFLFLHLLIVDGVQHKNGPLSAESFAALEHADKNVGEVIDCLKKTGIYDQTTVFITADHGFCEVRKTIHASAILQKAGYLELKGSTVASARVQAVSEGGTAFIYYNATNITKADEKKIIGLFDDVEGIERIVKPSDYKKYGMPLPKDNQASPNLILAAKDGYGFSGRSDGEFVEPLKHPTGSHGYINTNPKMNAVFIAVGRSIKQGKRVGVFENINVAPTVAWLLGEKYPCDGKVLKQILDESQK